MNLIPAAYSSFSTRRVNITVVICVIFQRILPISWITWHSHFTSHVCCHQHWLFWKARGRAMRHVLSRHFNKFNYALTRQQHFENNAKCVKMHCERFDKMLITMYLKGRSFGAWSSFLEHHKMHCMMTSSNGNILLLTGPLWGKSTGHQWIPLTKTSDAGLWCFLWSPPEQTAEQSIKTPVIWYAVALIMTSL